MQMINGMVKLTPWNFDGLPCNISENTYLPWLYIGVKKNKQVNIDCSCCIQMTRRFSKLFQSLSVHKLSFDRKVCILNIISHRNKNTGRHYSLSRKYSLLLSYSVINPDNKAITISLQCSLLTSLIDSLFTVGLALYVCCSSHSTAMCLFGLPGGKWK